MTFKYIRKEAEIADGNLFLMLYKRFLYKKKYKKNILSHHRVLIKHIENISIGRLLKIGIDPFNFVGEMDSTYLNISGKLDIKGNYSIGKGCRFDIGEHAVMRILDGGYVAPNTSFVIMNGLSIGKNTAISWNCHFLDEDFHDLDYEGRKKKSGMPITIGDHVWIGCNTNIYKGVNIPNGCVVAANSVVKTSFTEENILIGGNPATILKRNITWD